MPISIAQLHEAIAEAERFVALAKKASCRLNSECDSMEENFPDLRPGPRSDHVSFGSPETAAVRRASMDLTRKLAELRKR